MLAGKLIDDPTEDLQEGHGETAEIIAKKKRSLANLTQNIDSPEMKSRGDTRRSS
ncbi:hypothetical protein [Lysinibacillus xylanilyticus]|uniref:Uncharacterized protein n=1 Tax=Lysinibacillus xylanilyticus TaxID=582475 RepID=A0ABT4EV16_9BACI|nr:hypothetical protein [Lysinibacillus xylanilyticus]MCY9548316.1 hypothetical protein [Lysinibacillus xylanilyticus]